MYPKSFLSNFGRKIIQRFKVVRSDGLAFLLARFILTVDGLSLQLLSTKPSRLKETIERYTQFHTHAAEAAEPYLAFCQYGYLYEASTVSKSIHRVLRSSLITKSKVLTLLRSQDPEFP